MLMTMPCYMTKIGSPNTDGRESSRFRQVNCDIERSVPTQRDRGCGRLPFTTTFRKFRLESKWYTTFRVVPVENFREQRKGSPVFPDGMFQTEIRVPFVKT